MGSLTSRATLPPFLVLPPVPMSKLVDFWGWPSDSSFFDHHHFVFQAVFGGEIFFSQQIFWIFGAPASEMHTITEYNSPDLWTFCKSCGGAQKRCEMSLYIPPEPVLRKNLKVSHQLF